MFRVVNPLHQGLPAIRAKLSHRYLRESSEADRARLRKIMSNKSLKDPKARFTKDPIFRCVR